MDFPLDELDLVNPGLDEELERIVNSLEDAEESVVPAFDFLQTTPPCPPMIPLDIVTPTLTRVPYTVSQTATPSSSQACSSRDSMVPEIPSYNLPSYSDGGEIGFGVTIDNTGSGWKFVEEDRHLFIKRNVFVPCVFSTRENESLPPNSTVRIIAKYTLLTDQETKGAVRNPTGVNSCRFIESSSVSAKYTSYRGHDSVELRVADLTCSSEGPFGVVKFTCTSSELHGNRTKRAPPLLLIFQLIVNGEVVAVDIINLKVCCCYQRDSRKRKASVLDNAVDNKPTVVDDVIREFDPRLDLARDIKPDKDGNYSFYWRGKDKRLLNVFMCLKMGYENQ